MRKDKPPPTPRERALALLARREHSARELQRKLVHKGVAGDDAKAVVGELGERAWQNDARFAESLVRRRASDGYGPSRIRAELAMHGIGREAASAAIAAAEPDWLGIAKRVFAAKYHDAAGVDARERQKRAAWLAARGFDAAMVRAVTRADPED